MEWKEELNANSSYKHYYFKFGEKNFFFEEYYNSSTGFRNTNIVPLAIYFNKWKVEGYNNPESKFYDEFNKNNSSSKKQIQAFMNCGTSELEKSIFWVFYKNDVYALKPYEGITNGQVGDIEKHLEERYSFPKVIPSKIIRTISKDDLPENFVTLNANQHYNRKTIALLSGKEAAVADFLINPLNNQKLKIRLSESLQYLSPIQFETLIFLILHHNNIFVSTHRGGTLEAIDLKIEITDKSKLSEFGSSGRKFIQIKMFDYQIKKHKLKSEANSYLIYLGSSDVENRILGKDWLEKQIESKTVIQEWLKKSLDWYEIEEK